MTSASVLLDLRGMRCPLPVLKIRKALTNLTPGDTIIVLTDDPLAGLDVPNFVRQSNNTLIEVRINEKTQTYLIKKS